MSRYWYCHRVWVDNSDQVYDCVTGPIEIVVPISERLPVPSDNSDPVIKPCSRFHGNCFPNFCRFTGSEQTTQSRLQNSVPGSTEIAFPISVHLLIPSRQLGSSYRNRVSGSTEIVFPILVIKKDLKTHRNCLFNFCTFYQIRADKSDPVMRTVFPVSKKLFYRFLYIFTGSE